MVDSATISNHSQQLIQRHFDELHSKLKVDLTTQIQVKHRMQAVLQLRSYISYKTSRSYQLRMAFNTWKNRADHIAIKELKDENATLKEDIQNVKSNMTNDLQLFTQHRMEVEEKLRKLQMTVINIAKKDKA